MQAKTLTHAIAGLLGAGSLLLAADASANSLQIGGDNAAGINYHLNFSFDAPGTLSATSGDTLTGGTVAQIGSRSWSDRVVSNDPNLGPAPCDTGFECGWTHNSKWSLVNLDGLTDGTYKVTMTLERPATGDLVPALTAFSGEQISYPAAGVGGVAHWYTNMFQDSNTDGTYDVNGTVWWASDLQGNGIGYDTAADNASNTLATLFTYVTVSGGSADPISIAMGGNDPNLLLAKHNTDFKMTVGVQAVPIPAAVWLFSSALAGLTGLARRRNTASV